jgi:hypothetical protein
MRFTEGGQPDHLAFGGVYKNKGGSQQTATDNTSNTSGTSSTQLPPWLTDAAQQAVGTARTISQDPNFFNPYPGQQVADVSPGTQAGFQYGQTEDPIGMANQIGGATGGIYNALANYLPQNQSYIQQGLGGAQQAENTGQQGAQGAIATGLSQGQASINTGLANAQQSMQGGLSNAQGLLGAWGGGPVTAQQIAQGAQSMMSPYTQAVIDPTMALGKQALQQNLQQVGANANQAGAFGGSRQGVQEGVAQSQAALGESNILGNLLNTGYGQALGVAGTLGNNLQQDRYGAASTLAQMAGNQGSTLAGLQAQGGGQFAGLLGSGANTLANANYGAGNTLAQLQATGGGQMAGYNQADINNALTTGSGLPQQYLQNLLGIGGLQQSQQQAGLNAAQGNYYGQQQQPIQNLDLLLSAVSGVPYGTSGTMTGTGTTSGTTTGTTTPSTVDQIGSYLGLISKVAQVGGAAAGI